MRHRVKVVEKILGANDQLAQENRARLDEAGVVSLNFMATPGAGKTSLIERTIKSLGSSLKIAYVDGDVATSIDADRVAQLGVPVVQINTGGDCHLDAVMLQGALDELPLAELDLLIVENVGNLICPASFQLGTHAGVLIASVPEGDDKPYKYPAMYRDVAALVINKTDLLDHVDFDMDYFRCGVEALNPGLRTFPLSCRSGAGVADWLGWVISMMRAQQAGIKAGAAAAAQPQG